MYRRGYSIPLLRCIAHDEVKRVLHDVHEGECGDHTRGKHLPRKYSDMDIIGLLLIAMLWTMLKNVINAKNTLGFLEPHLLR